jgi:hypothetical protein
MDRVSGDTNISHTYISRNTISDNTIFSVSLAMFSLSFAVSISLRLYVSLSA